ncbi:MAG: hypothetical protein IIA50_03770, partial [Bacteroidetes bacterium]|nr:hypothetical protein [Bacteroidota bacterium]
VVEQSILAIKGRILAFASVVQNKLFPLAMGLMIIFGITKIAAANVREEVAADPFLNLFGLVSDKSV